MLINKFPLMIKTRQDFNEQWDHMRISSDFKAALTHDILRCCSHCWLTGLYSAPSLCHISIYIKTLWFYNLVGVLTGNVEEKRFDQEMESKEEEDQEMDGKEKDYEEMESKEEVESQAQDSQEPVLDLQPTLDPDSFDE